MSRRRFLAATTAAAATAAAPRPTLGFTATRGARQRPLGSGGEPMPLEQLATLARGQGDGYPVLFLDLAALDGNVRVVTDFARAQNWAVRPALKSFRSPKLIAYLLRRLPQPRGLVFNLYEVDPIVAAAPRGTDLMTGYPPTFGELRSYLRSAPPRGQRRHRLRILIDSVPLMEELARRARQTPRPLPIEVALELDVGMGRGGMNGADEIGASLDILRAERRRLKLTAVLGYDGHATLRGDPPYRRLVATQAQAAYRSHLNDLAELGSDLYDARTLVRNGPGSSNYRNWVGGPANEISPGSAFLFARYLEDGYDTGGLEYALAMAGGVRRVTSDHPSVPVTGTSPPNADEQEIIVQGVGDPGELVYPEGAREDEASGGGDSLVVPKGSVGLGDYVIYRPLQTEVGIQRFDSIVAVRNGKVRRRWPVFARPAGKGSRAAQSRTQ